MARNRQRARDRKRRKAADGEPEVEETSAVDDARDADEPAPEDLDAELAPEELDAELAEDLDDDDSEADEELDADAGGSGDEPPPVSVTKRGSGEPEREKQQSIFKRSGAFLRASWAELQRVQWPDRQQVGQATAVVLGFVVIAGAFLGLADVIAQEIVDAIL